MCLSSDYFLITYLHIFVDELTEMRIDSISFHASTCMNNKLSISNNFASNIIIGEKTEQKSDESQSVMFCTVIYIFFSKTICSGGLGF